MQHFLTSTEDVFLLYRYYKVRTERNTILQHSFKQNRTELEYYSSSFLLSYSGLWKGEESQHSSILTVHFSLRYIQKLLKISCLLLQSIGGALFLLRLASNFCLVSAAVGLRRRPFSMKGSETRLSSSSGTWNVHELSGFSRIFKISDWFLTLAHLLPHLDAHV